MSIRAKKIYVLQIGYYATFEEAVAARNKRKKISLESFLRDTKYRESEIKDIFNEIRFLIQQDIVLEYNNKENG